MITIKSRLLTSLLMAIPLVTVNAAGTKDHSPIVTLAPGYSQLPFKAPIPGSYQLPVLGIAEGGNVVDLSNEDLKLEDLLGDKIVLLSFIYTTCSDVNGCPLATMVLHKIKSRLQKMPGIAASLRLITLSFDPEHDTPAVMQQYAQNFVGSGVEWRFLTTRSEQALQLILQHYPQAIQKVDTPEGKSTGTFSHNLRVYLIDNHKKLRNIYNMTFLHPDTLISDVQTLLAETQAPIQKSQPLVPLNPAQLIVAGDNKANYERKSYQTQSIALAARTGQAIDLFAAVQKPLLGLPPVPVPNDNPLTAAKINLGRKLFYDRRLSLNNTFSCAICHVPEQGFTNNEMATAVGVEGRSVRRNTPTLYNVAYLTQLFHDGRETTLEQQAWGPLLADNEMANPSIGQVINKIKASVDYQGLFEAAFNRSASMETIGMALASYERVLNSADSPFDRWYYGQDSQAISSAAKRGYQLFIGQAGCAKCHVVSADKALFTDQQLHNTGIGYADTNMKASEVNKVQIAPGLFAEIPKVILQKVAEPKASDLGQYEVTQNPLHRWRYKTPSLRNVSLTAPYMHNGSLTKLQDVVDFYNLGGIANENLDPLIKPLHLKSSEIDDLVVFLQSLTGSNVHSLVTDAFEAPIGDIE